MGGSAAVIGLSKPVWGLIAAAAFMLLIHLLAPILMPFLLAAVLAYIGDPLADRLEARGMARSMAVVTVFFVLSLFAVLVMLVTVPLLIAQIQLLIERTYDGVAWLQQTGLPALRHHLDLPEQKKPMDAARDALSKHWGSAGGIFFYLWDKVSGSSMALLAWSANMVLVPVVTFYLLRDWDVLMAAIRNLLPRSMEARTVVIAQQCDEILGAFARGQLLVMLVLAVTYTLGLWIVGLELALVLGMVAGLASIVPYLGVIIGISAAGLAAFFQFDSWWPIAGVAAVFAIGQALESMVLTPMLVGDKIGLHPVVVIFAILAGGQLFGFVGILLALPVAAVIKVMIDHLHDYYKQSELYESTRDVVELEIDE
ncbi:MAG: putative PurR-regulated permease PerM [Zhongshania sp.]|jgi:predicted PurR-regulated permease PerM